jgi:ABC-type Zn uptake system ZnuABC Zn-binding protein ZnuA
MAVGAEAAWFFCPYVGVGGRLRVKSMPVKGWSELSRSEEASFKEYASDPLMAGTLSKVSLTVESDRLTEFAADFGLKQLSIEKDGKEPGAQWMQSLVAQCRQDSVRVILVQPEFSPAMARTLAGETGAAIVSVNPLSYDWENEMLHIAKALKNGK